MVRFFARCGNTVKSQALLLRQFILSLVGWATDWYFSLPANSIPDWDIMADRFYRTFYKPWPIEIEMPEHLDGEGTSSQTYDFIEGTIEEKIETAFDLREMGSYRPRDLFPLWVKQTPFSEGYELPNVVLYEGYGDPQKHISIFL